MADLKNCPFCGGEAECYRTVIKTNLGYSDAVAVRCAACGAKTGYVLFDGRKHPNGEEYTEAIEAWNRRAESEELKFTRQFIHEHGLDFALASAWSRRAEDGKT